MIFLLTAVLPIFLLLVLSEVLWRAKILRGENARKLLHIIIGSYVAVWPFFLSGRQIEGLSLAMFVGVAISHKFKIFHAILDVKRKTLGDLLYAVGIGITAFLFKSPWIFAIAILHLSIGDGLAGLVGVRHGKNNKYLVWGQDKSLAGTIVFAVCSLAILSLAPIYQHVSIGSLLVLLPVTAALVENVSIYGTDNVTIPLLITLALNSIL